MNRQYLLWASTLIILIVTIGGVWWHGIGSWVWMSGLALAIVLLVVYILTEKDKMKVRPLFISLLVVGIVILVIGMKLVAPELTPAQVKSIFRSRFTGTHIEVVSAKYNMRGQWQVRLTSREGGWIYIIFDERTGEDVETSTSR